MIIISSTNIGLKACIRLSYSSHECVGTNIIRFNYNTDKEFNA